MGGNGERGVDAGATGTLPPGTLTALLRRIAGEEPAGPGERPFEPGAVVGRYEIVRELGRGGFGVVYEARDRELGRSVALKAVFAGAREELRQERLWREAEAAARLSHPNLVALHDAGRSERGPYLVLELLRGRTLAQRLREGPLSTPEAVHVAVEVAKGVAHAHGQGVVHRDLKPGNVFLCDDGQVKALDFGLAHAFGRRRQDGGTPAYMAPEQREGAPEDERTDVWALGAILFEMLSGRLPFEEGKTGREAPALEVPGAPALGAIVKRMLAPRPVDRPRDGAEALKALAAVERELGPAAPAAGRVRVRRRGVLKLAALTAASVALGVGVAWLVGRGPAARKAPPSVAVLPFADMSPGKDQEYFADGIAEEILNRLAQVGGLRVIGRTSSFSFKGRSEDLRTIGEKLEVGTVLEGSVRRSGERIRVTAQLARATDGVQLWSRTFDRELSDVFAVQDEIARAVAGALRVKLLPGEAMEGRGGTSRKEAYDQYLLGLDLERARTPESFERALAAYRKALAIDSRYAQAWAGVSRALWFLVAIGGIGGQPELVRETLEAAERAVALAPDLAAGHLARAYARLSLFMDLPGARDDLERARALSPGDARTLLLHGMVLVYLGRQVDAIAALERAAAADPLDAFILENLGRAYLVAGDGARAAATWTRSLEIAPGSDFGRYFTCVALLVDGKPREALRIAGETTAPHYRLICTAMAEHDLGHARESRAALEALVADYADDWAYQVSEVHAWRGEADRAFEWLERARNQLDGGIFWIKTDPLLRKIRSDPRYPALLRKMNLPVD